MAAKDAGPDTFARLQTVFLELLQECEIASGHSVSETQETVHQEENNHLLLGIFVQQAVGSGISCFDSDRQNFVF